MKQQYEPGRCECCDQTTDYVYALNKGTVHILKAFSRHVDLKGINMVHIEKELVNNGITGNQYANVKILTAHGLLAKAKDEAGNYVITRKGLDFLQGKTVAKYAIVSKALKRQIGYWNPEEEVCSIKNFNTGEYWEGVNYEIKEGRVIRNLQTTI